MAASKPGRLMRFEARRTYPAEPSIVRALLTDPSVLRQIVPGCESLRLLESGEFALTLALRIGQGVRQFNGHLAQADTESGDTFTYYASSESHGEKLTGRGIISLANQDDGISLVLWQAELAIDGELHSVSPRMLQTTARAFARRTHEALERQISLRTRTFTTTTAALQAAPGIPAGPPNFSLVAVWRVLTVAVTLLTSALIWRRVRSSAK